MALPLYLFLVLRNHNTRKMLMGVMLGLLFLAVPFLAYHEALAQYVQFVWNYYIISNSSAAFVLWDYEYVPLYSIVALQGGYFLNNISKEKLSSVFGHRLEVLVLTPQLRKHSSNSQ